MPRWLTRVLARIHALAANRLVQLTYKVVDFAERIVSEHDGTWMYVFLVEIESTTVYLKVIVHSQCLVVSFHEDKASETDA